RALPRARGPVALPLGGLEHDDRDLPLPGPPLVDVVAGVAAYDQRPEPLALRRARDPRPVGALLAADHEAHVRVGDHVPVPGRVPRVAAARGDEEDAIAVAGEEERGRALGAALGAAHPQEPHAAAAPGRQPAAG